MDHEITVYINDKPITLTGERHTGSKIKQVAIEEGVLSDSDFVLSLECGTRQTRVIDDLKAIEITCDARIVAIPDDDNS